MKLAEFTAQLKRALLDELMEGREPSQGEFDAALLKQARALGQPRMGSTTFHSGAITSEFIYSDSSSSTIVVSIRVASPQRIVFMPVPSWVVETIWQGDIDGSYHFESDAMALLEDFRKELTAAGNEKWFEKQMAKRRE